MVPLKSQTPIPVIEERSVAFPVREIHTSSKIKFGDKFVKVSDVISPKVLRSVNDVIKEKEDDGFFAFPEPTNYKHQQRLSKGKRSKICTALRVVNNGHLNYQYNLMTDVSGIHFNKKNKITNRSHIEHSMNNGLRYACKEMVDFAEDSLQSMARMADWSDKTVFVRAMSIIRYPVTKEENQGSLPWHQDFTGSTSLVVLMNSKTGEEGTGYTGGGLETAEVEVDERKKFDTGLKIKKETIESHDYDENVGFFFTNCERLMHKAEAAEISDKTKPRALTEKRLLNIVAEVESPTRSTKCCSIS